MRYWSTFTSTAASLTFVFGHACHVLQKRNIFNIRSIFDMRCKHNKTVSFTGDQASGARGEWPQASH